MIAVNTIPINIITNGQLGTLLGEEIKSLPIISAAKIILIRAYCLM